MPVKFEQNRMVQTTQNFAFFDKKLFFFNHLLKSISCCLMLNYYLKDYHRSVIQKLR